MLSRRRFLASLAASVALRPTPASAAADPQPCSPTNPPEQLWSYSQAHTLAVQTNSCVPELPPPALPWTAPALPAFDPATVGSTLRRRFPLLRQHFVFEYTPWYTVSPWRHWNQWLRVPPLDVAASSMPRLGP